MKRLIALLLVAMVLFMSCSTMTHINVVPSDAKIKLNDQTIDTGTQSLSNFDFTDYSVQISKDGYKTLNTSLKKEFKVGAFIVGLLLWWPELLFVYGPAPNQTFELEPLR
jgi:hypothetical protein